MSAGYITKTAKVWRKTGKRGVQVATLQKGTRVVGEKNGDFYFLTSPVNGYTKSGWVKEDSVIVVNPPAEPPVTGAYFAWDDQNPDYGYKCRTQQNGWQGPDNPPAVLRFYPEPIDKMGDFRVDVSDWKQFVIDLNGGDVHKWEYWCGPGRAQFNQSGWPRLMYVGMSGNPIKVLETTAEWVKFATMKPSELNVAKLLGNRPEFIHSFHCVTWDTKTKTTKHILSTGTNRGTVLYPLITEEGFAWIPRKHVAGL